MFSKELIAQLAAEQQEGEKTRKSPNSVARRLAND
jgi:hypothetical protein